LLGCRVLAAQVPETTPTAPEAATKPIFITEYRVEGAKQIGRVDVESAVYPYMGPERTTDDIEGARAALEKAYRDKGYQTVTVEIPQQLGQRGIIILKVVENKVGRLRVKGSRYFDIEAIKRQAPSLAEGSVPNFNDVTRDLVRLNTLPDRRITPALRPGVEPGTVDIDLNVKDTFPLHGNVELNNRAAPDTTALRLNGSVSYNNLWQLGHSVGVSFQVSPQDRSEVKVLSGYYIARFPQVDWLSLMFNATKQNSNVSTIGQTAVAGNGQILGGRALITLPAKKNFYHSMSFGLDYKDLRQLVQVGAGTTAATVLDTPTEYYPWNLGYNATWANKNALTELNTNLVFGARGTEPDRSQFENSRFRADSNFFYLRGDLAHTQTFKGGAEIYAKVQGQLADQPLINSEQVTGGGLGTVRGYLEAEVVGDSGVFGSVELRSPSLLGWAPKVGEWRVYGFLEGGTLTLHDPLPEQDGTFRIASVGVGSRLQLVDHLGGSIDLGVPLISQSRSQAHDPHVIFRVWADF